jgi:hypothetical protein
VARASSTLRRVELAFGIDLTLETIEEGESGVLGQLTRVVRCVEGVRRDSRAERTLLWCEPTDFFGRHRDPSISVSTVVLREL